MDSEKAVVDELPLAIVRRVVKDKLSECSPDYDVSIHKEALLAFSESARIFIHYLSATANDICKDSRRQTMKAEDVFKALEDMDFSEFLEPLKASLDDFKKKNAGKKAASGSGAAVSKPKETKKRKNEEASTQKGVRKSKRDEGDLKNGEDDENDNTKENEDDYTEENGDNEEEEEEDVNGNEENIIEENENEGNSMEEAGSGSGEDDENEGSGEDVEGDDEDE
ncbi:unnamed protein product [Eruca vesicaria subsp. sativa]|uniref:Transcription factor CBF/NF-Y/archaeal histone domain-containing protein n=1 Tax=Eruca vesicaria subsp. sativa TaxID=29727 RepID=A0ABC8KU84_ERUVS|nr:unnamed protein product [Eruca vesicaria subsp. sativa]